jgi:DNA-binding MarR family transcriptional regulator
VNPEHFQNLDRLIHEKARMAIMALLAASPELSFTEIRDTLKMTDRTLQEAGYIAVTKSFREKRPRTTCALTTAGRRAFQGYIDTLGKIIEQSR